MVPEVLHHKLFSLENSICDLLNKMCNFSNSWRVASTQLFVNITPNGAQKYVRIFSCRAFIDPKVTSIPVGNLMTSCILVMIFV
jgi:hypothetical protein